MRTLILGGTHFVGRATAELAVAAGHDVAVLHRELTSGSPRGAVHLQADRSVPGALPGAVRGRTWDWVLDTWSGAPAVVAEAAGPSAPRRRPTPTSGAARCIAGRLRTAPMNPLQSSTATQPTPGPPWRCFEPGRTHSSPGRAHPRAVRGHRAASMVARSRRARRQGVRTGTVRSAAAVHRFARPRRVDARVCCR
jgi:hypothetical protein